MIHEKNAVILEKVFGWERLVGDEVPAKYRHSRSMPGQRQAVWVKDDDYICSLCTGAPGYDWDWEYAWEIVAEFRSRPSRERERFLAILRQQVGAAEHMPSFWMFLTPKIIRDAAYEYVSRETSEDTHD